MESLTHTKPCRLQHKQNKNHQNKLNTCYMTGDGIRNIIDLKEELTSLHTGNKGEGIQQISQQESLTKKKCTHAYTKEVKTSDEISLNIPRCC